MVAEMLIRNVKRISINTLFSRFMINWWPYYQATWFIIGITGVCYGLRPFVGYHALGSIYLLAIMIVASFGRSGPILFTAILSALTWNYFFIPPDYTVVIGSSDDLMMVASFFFTAVILGYLKTRLKRQELALQSREQTFRNLYEFVNQLAETTSVDDVLNVLTDVIDKQFSARSFVVLEKDLLKTSASKLKRIAKDFEAGRWVRSTGSAAGWSKKQFSDSRCLILPMKAKSKIIGVLYFYPHRRHKILNPDQETFLQAIVSQSAMAIERINLSRAVQEAQLHEESERLHQTLINSVSHELRTPITSILGASMALRNHQIISDGVACDSLATTIVDSAHRLNRVVENLLDISRLEKGSLQLKREWFEASDLVREVKNELKNELSEHEFIISGEVEHLVEGDFRLLSHAFCNLVLNAVKYSPHGEPIEMEITKSEQSILISIKDGGPGIPKGLEQKIFDKFYRLPGSRAGGLGLGLSIVKSIVELHGGIIGVKNRCPDRGAIFNVELPVPPVPHILFEALR